ncbi:unnamed protein product [Ranitomeya imitator]|uniref:Myb/SANT-like DNA-binding domain-containing protein n=1 Tax=Ranitomeya imitator TaxID=111125 RepID=A0ABN9MK37_9NEOB|nr:unnamed protein product [Ranitomeya imitator]
MATLVAPPPVHRHFRPHTRGKMAAPCNSELPSEASSCLKIPKSEVLSPPSPGLSDGNRSLSNPSTPSRSSPLSAGVSGGGAGLSGASPSVSFSTACRGMSWTPAETNALIAVWGNERLEEGRYQQLECAGTIFGTKAPGPAMYDRVSRALAELGYERTPSQCRERMKAWRPRPISNGHSNDDVIKDVDISRFCFSDGHSIDVDVIMVAMATMMS